MDARQVEIVLPFTPDDNENGVCGDLQTILPFMYRSKDGSVSHAAQGP